VEFKRGVYEMALIELARFLPRTEYRNRFLRGGLRQRDAAQEPAHDGRSGASFDLPPGATFEPGPQSSQQVLNGDDPDYAPL